MRTNKYDESNKTAKQKLKYVLWFRKQSVFLSQIAT